MILCIYMCIYIYIYIYVKVHVCVLVTQSYLTHCNSMACSPPVSSVHEILQASILAWVASPFSRGSSQSRDQTWVSLIAGRFVTTVPSGKPKVLLL